MTKLRKKHIWILNISILAFFSVLQTACSKKLIAENTVKVERKKTQELLDKLDSISLRKPNTFYTKIATKFKDTTQDVSFKTSIRLVKDSAINALITYATLPVFNSIVTPDSVQILNKRQKCITKTKLSYIKENFGIAFEYKNVEELLLGLPLAYDGDQKYFQIHDPYNYIISSHRKREIKKADKKEKLQDDIIIKYFLNTDLSTLKKLEIESKEDTAKIEVNFLSWQMVDSFSVPQEVYIVIQTARNKMEISMNYDKVQINVPQQIVFVIPEEYGECN